ncbi:MAG: DJ-1/PfpI family protein [Paramuribaculum sp.]|nr:DJ-1/PfpI family protein [Paramuribaculum sp.]MDE6652436.1 DJ-1/PfpI family protein [Paramuribaculum sp.]
MKHSFIFLAPGFEEIEALATVDVLRRAEMTVTTVAVTAGSKTVEGAHGVKVEADIHINDADLANAEWLICPGGMPGAANLAANKKVSAALTDQFKKGGKIAAICASPAIVLEPLGILAGREATCYPGMEGYIKTGIFQESPVVAHPTLITGNGPATTLRFALAIVRNSKGDEKAEEVGSAMLYYSKSSDFYF